MNEQNEEMTFEEIPFEELDLDALDLEELESRLEMAGASDAEVGVTVTWRF